MSAPDEDFGIIEDAPADDFGIVADDDLGIVADENPEPIDEDPNAARDNVLSFAAKHPASRNVDESLQTYATAKALKVPMRMVEADPKGYFEAFQQSRFEPQVWARENPELSKIALEHPELAPMLVSTNKEKGMLTKLFNKLGDLYDEVRAPREFFPPEGYAGGLNPTTPDEFAAKNANREAEQEAARTKRDAPQEVVKISTPESEAIRKQGGVKKLYAQAETAQAGVDLSKRSFDLMKAQMLGEETTDIEADIAKLEVDSIPRYYGEDGLLSQVVEGSVSTFGVLKGAGAGAAVMGGLGATAAGAAALATTKNPATIGPAMEAGMYMGFRIGGTWGAANESFVMETGSTWRELGSVKTDSGNALSGEERAGAAIIAGSLKTGIELLELKALAKTLGPATALIEQGGVEKLKSLLANDPSFRRLAAKAAVQYFKSSAEEGLEGGAQEATDQGVKYLVASKADGSWQQGPVFDAGKIVEATEAEAIGALGLGAAGTVLGLSASALAVGKSKAAAHKTDVLLEFSAQKEAQAAPEVFAKAVADATRKNGEEVTALHVKGEALGRYFQSHTKEEADAELTEALGPDGPAKAAEAVSTGGSLEVPIATVFASYGKSPMAKALAADTATQAGHLTPAELAAGGAEKIEKEAKALTEAELTKQAEKAAFAKETTVIRDQLVEAGRTKRQANTEVAVLTHFYETQAAVLGIKPEELLQQYRVKVGIGDEAAIVDQPGRVNQSDENGNPSGSLALSQMFHDQDDEARQRAFFIDTTTGVLNRRAFERLDPAGRQVGAISIEGVKYTNDALGHEGGNSVYRAAAQALAPHAPEVAKVGGDFALYVSDQAELDAILAKANASAVLGGHQLSGAVGPDLRSASAAANAAKASAEAAGTRAERGQRPKLAVSETPVALAADLVVGTPLSDQLIAEYAKLSPEDAFHATYTEASTGLLTKDGFDAVPRKKFVASIDLNGLKELNNILGEAFGDSLLETFGNSLRILGGSDFDAAHISGDEYAAQHDDEVALKAWLSKVELLLETATVPLPLNEGLQKYLNLQSAEMVLQGLPFGFGVGETVDNAEHELNAHKQRLLEAGKRGEGAASRRIVAAAAGGVQEAPRTVSAESDVDNDGRQDPSDQVGRQRFVDQETVAKRRLHQENEADAAKAGFHSPNAFGKPGTPENAVVEDMLEELGAQPAEQLTSQQIRNAWETALVRLPGDEFTQAIRTTREVGQENFATHLDRAEAMAAKEAGSPDYTAAIDEPVGDTLAPEAAKKREVSYWKNIEKAVRLALEGDRTLLYSLDPKNPAGTPRGYTALPNDPLKPVFEVMLNKSADASTVIHESAHVFLEIIRDLAAKPEAPARVKQHYADALSALGVEEGKQPEREHHEKFARAFEAWLLEGKSPTPALETLFVRFSLWLKSIYRSIASLNVELSPELRSVFDRLLASDEEIAAARAKHGPDIFANAEEADVSPEAWLEQKQAEGELLEKETRRAQLFALKDRLRETEKWWKDERAAHVKEFEAAYEELPARKAQQALIDGDVVLSREAVEKVIGTARVEGLRISSDPSKVTDTVETIAVMSGFPTSETLLAALAGLKPAEKWVNEQADARMSELHPSVLEDRTQLRKLVGDGVSKFFERKITNTLSDLGKKTAAANPGLIESTKMAAKMIVEGSEVIGLSPARALANAFSAAKQAAAAAAKGDLEATREAVTKQLLNESLHRELTDAVEDRDAFGKLVRKLNKRPAQEQLGKASAEYQDAVNFILEALGEREPQGEPIAALPELGEWVAPVRAALERDVETLTVGEMRIITDALEWVSAAARDAVTAIVDRKRFDKEQLIAELIADAESNKKKSDRPLSSSEGAESPLNALRGVPAALKGYVLKPEVMFSWLGGELVGKDWTRSPWFTGMTQTIEDARVRASDLMKEVVEPIAKAFEGMPAEVRAGFFEPIDGAKLFPNHQVRSGQAIEAPTMRFQLIMMALNFGNPSNTQRLLEGRSITSAQMVNALNLLTKEEIALVNAVWAAHEKLKPLAFDLEFKSTGLRPVGFEATPTKLANGVLTGGYVPAVYDRRVEATMRQHTTDVDDILNEQMFGVAATKRGHLKARADNFSAAIQLDPDGLMSQLHQSVHDIAFREAVRSVAGVLFDEKIDTTLRERLGDSATKALQDWIKAVATPTEVQAADNLTMLSKVVRTLKGNIVYNALGYSLPNFIEDFSNIPLALPSSDLKASYLSKGLMQALRSPVETWKTIEERSPAMRAANDSRVRDITRQIQSLKPTWLQKTPGVGAVARNRTVVAISSAIEEHAFDLMEASFKMTAAPVWMGRYQQALDAGENSERATELADAVIRRVFPTHGTTNSTALQRNKLWGTLLMFDGFMSTVRNTYLTEAQKIVEAPGAKQKTRAAGAIAATLLITGAYSAFLRGRGPDDDEPWADWLERKSITNMFEIMVPGSAEFVQGIEAKVRGKHYTPRGGYVSGFVSTLGGLYFALVDDNKDTSQKLEAIVRMLGPFTKLPITQPLRTGKYVFGRPIEGPIEAASGVIYGENDEQPLNPVNVLSSEKEVPPMFNQ